MDTKFIKLFNSNVTLYFVFRLLIITIPFSYALFMYANPGDSGNEIGAEGGIFACYVIAIFLLDVLFCTSKKFIIGPIHLVIMTCILTLGIYTLFKTSHPVLASIYIIFSLCEYIGIMDSKCYRSEWIYENHNVTKHRKSENS